jgi:hypothetical protein
MPDYTFKNKKTGKRFNKSMSMSELDVYLAKNKNIEQMIVSASIGDPWSMGITQPPADFSKYVLGRIKEKAPGPAIERRFQIAKEI